MKELAPKVAWIRDPPPNANAWAVDNGSSHAGRASIERLEGKRFAA